jgi:hypothetical protein
MWATVRAILCDWDRSSMSALTVTWLYWNIDRSTVWVWVNVVFSLDTLTPTSSRWFSMNLFTEVYNVFCFIVRCTIWSLPHLFNTLSDYSSVEMIDRSTSLLKKRSDIRRFWIESDANAHRCHSMPLTPVLYWASVLLITLWYVGLDVLYVNRNRW